MLRAALLCQASLQELTAESAVKWEPGRGKTRLDAEMRLGQLEVEAGGRFKKSPLRVTAE